MKRKKDKERQGVEEEQRKRGFNRLVRMKTLTRLRALPHHPIRHPSVTLSGFLWKLAGAGTDKYTSVTHALHTLPKQ